MSDHLSEQQGVHVFDSVTQDLQYSADASLSAEQIKEHADEFLHDPNIHLLFGDQPVWSLQEYMDKLETIPSLKDMVKKPYLLAVTLRALPKAVGPRQDLVDTRIVRARLYDKIVEQWFALSLERLESSILSSVEREALTELVKDGFVAQGIDYLKRLADAIFTRQNGNPVIQYTHIRDKDTWKAEFFDSDPKIRLLREASPLTSTVDTIRFSHRSILEYFFSCTIFSPSKHDPQDEGGFTDVQPLDPESPLFTRSFICEPSVIQFLSDRVQENPSFKDQLLEAIERSKSDPSLATATTNSITILVKAGVRFGGADLRGIRVPRADVSDFDSAQFQEADLAGINLSRRWLLEADSAGHGRREFSSESYRT
ncbi:hypothetical protein BGZ89_001438 [Linnemannia elongata]|nr:hypothetical protein BGZ89_001438 [Linnemannia elongata]